MNATVWRPRQRSSPALRQQRSHRRCSPPPPLILWLGPERDATFSPLDEPGLQEQRLIERVSDPEARPQSEWLSRTCRPQTPASHRRTSSLPVYRRHLGSTDAVQDNRTTNRSGGAQLGWDRSQPGAQLGVGKRRRQHHEVTGQHARGRRLVTQPPSWRFTRQSTRQTPSARAMALGQLNSYQTRLFTGTSRNGSDGTRTRDLRRDRRKAAV